MSRKRDTMLNECRKFFPGCTAQEAHALFWNATCFPFGCIDRIRKDLKEAANASDRNPYAAIGWAHEELEKAMRGVKP